MRFQTPLVPARLIRRYKRFLADCTLSDGREVVAHCANPGAMLGLAEPGTRIWLEPNDDPKKKLKFGWRLTELADGTLVGVDTGVPNRVVGPALRERRISAFAGYSNIRAEVPYAQKSRIDFLLSAPGLADLYIEVKSVTLSRQPGLAEFPDSVTARGARHLADLAQMVQQGHRAAMLYLVQRKDCASFAVARDIDPAYGAAFAAARQAGVEVFCFGTHMTRNEMKLGPQIISDGSGALVSAPLAD